MLKDLMMSGSSCVVLLFSCHKHNSNIKQVVTDKQQVLL